MSIENYIKSLPLSNEPFSSSDRAMESFETALPSGTGTTTPKIPDEPIPKNLKAAVNVGSILSFVDGVDDQEKADILFSVQFAQRGASGAFDRFTQTQSWYQKYTEILENVGWAMEQMAFARYDQSEGELRMDKAALAIITAIATQGQLAVLQTGLKALESVAEDDDTISLFDFHTAEENSGNFQIGAVQKAENGALSLAIGAFYFRSVDARRRFLFFSWGEQEVNFWTAAQKMTLNKRLYEPNREKIEKILAKSAADYIEEVKLG